MLKSLIATLERAYEGQRHFELLRGLWDQERWFDTPHQRNAGELARAAMASAGLAEARLVPFPADGKARFQDWTTHLAWDCPAAKLSLADEVICDRSEHPQGVVYWSGPLKTTTAPVVDIDSLKTITSEQLRGRFALSSLPPLEAKEKIRGTGALAVISDYIAKCPGHDENTVKWCNTWGDGRDGWYLLARDQVLPGFCLSPRRGRELRQRMAGDSSLKITGFCDSRLYNGESWGVTALLPGQDPSREIWLYAHGFECGAHDNCSGVTAIIEAAAMLQGLIKSGALPPPRFGIRLLFTEECLGMAVLTTQLDRERRKALAGFYLDGAGNPCRPDMGYALAYGPLSAPTFGWALAGDIYRMLTPQDGSFRLKCRCEAPTADNMVADPLCGVPSLLVVNDGYSYGYHSSADVPEACDPAILARHALAVAAWAYAMANMDDRWAGATLPAMRQWMDVELIGGGSTMSADAKHLRRWAAGQAIRQLSRWGVSANVYEAAADAYSPPDAQPLPNLPAGGRRYARRVWGTLTLQSLPLQRAAKFGRWDARQAASLYWTDGKRSIEAVKRLAEAEMNPTAAKETAPVDVDALMQACVDAGVANVT